MVVLGLDILYLLLTSVSSTRSASPASHYLWLLELELISSVVLLLVQMLEWVGKLVSQFTSFFFFSKHLFQLVVC